MEAIDGDGSAWSYLSASLFAREAQELGAIWHGLSWSDEAILGGDPWEEAPGKGARQTDHDRPSTPRSEWHWEERPPDEWRPQVRAVEGGVEVTFVSYDPVGRESLGLRTDRYGATGYTFTELSRELGYGSGGLIH